MHRTARAALSACLLVACGEDEVLTTTSAGTSTGTTEASPTSTGTTAPPTGSDPGTSTSGASNSGDESSTGTSTGTTAAIDPGTTTTGTTSDDTTTTGDTSTSTTGTTSDDTTTTGDDTTTSDDTTTTTTTGEPNLCGAPDFPDLAVPPQFGNCAAQQFESRWCLALGSGNNVTALGLDSQTACQVVQLQSPDVEIFAVGSLGVVGGDVFTCTSQFDGFVARIALSTGAVELSTTPCSAVTTWRGHVLVQTDFPNGDVRIFSDWPAVKQNQPMWALQPQGAFNETITVQGDTLYAAWHSDNHVQRFDLPCGEPLGDVVFANFDDWMQGIAVTDDNRLHTYGFDYPGVRSFDAASGVDAQAFPQVPVSGVALACFTQSD